MNIAADPASTATLLLSACLALFAASCLTPPAARGTGKPSDAPGATAPVTASLGDFTRTSPELLAKLRLGWNLGNSLDVPAGETAWGNPRATPELLATVAKAGFALVRIPVTWAQHLGPPPNYVIDSSWLERVAEVVGYARSARLYSIINTHHDGSWLSLKDANGNTTQENNATVKAQFVAVWMQIARYFANQGEELMFESMNEVHDGYGKADPRHVEIVNDLNQVFVDLVRASGGNNIKRHLIVPSYNTDINYALNGFKLPIDSAKNRLILSVHCYDPYLFALMGKTHTWGRASPGRDDWGQEDYIVAQFDKLKSRFVDQGIPVLVGEYGATHQDGYEDYRRYYMEYVTKAAVDRGLVPVYWDNGGSGSGGESFALIDRQNHSVFHPKIMEAMLRAATSSYSLRDIAPPVPAK